MLSTLLFALIFHTGALHVDVLAPDATTIVIPTSDISPDFRGPIKNVTAAVGREAVLTCTVNDLGHYKVGWMKADDQTILSLHTRVITHNPRIAVTHEDNFRTWQLRIRQLKESDRGCYMCQINTNSMRKQLGCVDVQDSQMDIEYSVCACVAGQVKCHHAAALAIHAHNNVSITDGACRWSAPAKKNSSKVMTLDEMFPLPKKFTAATREITGCDIDRLRSNLEDRSLTVGFTWLLQPNITACDLLVTDISEILFSQEYSTNDNKTEFFLNKMKISPEEILKTAKETTGQSTNPKWLVARKFRLTASNFGLVLKACQRKRYPESLFKTLMVPPDIDDSETSSDVTVSEGENVTLACKAKGHPPPRILWRREDGDHLQLHFRPHETERVDTFSGPRLGLLRVDRRQMGAYLCIASNDVPPAVSKRIVLHVNFAPVVKVPNQLVGTPLNTDVQLECYVEAFPNTINYWIKNREMLMNGKKHTITEEKQGYKVYMTLVIHNILKRDIGTYTCVATNSLGKLNGTIRVYEIKLQTKPPTTTTTEIRTTEKETTTPTYPQTAAPTIIEVTIPMAEAPMNNYLPSVEPAPLETMMSGRSSFLFPDTWLYNIIIFLVLVNHR